MDNSLHERRQSVHALAYYMCDLVHRCHHNVAYSNIIYLFCGANIRDYMARRAVNEMIYKRGGGGGGGWRGDYRDMYPRI